MIKIAALLLVVLFAGIVSKAQQVINVSDYGAVANSFADATPALQKAIAAVHSDGPVVLRFSQGRYDFWRQQALERNYYISNTSSEKECPSKIKKIGLLFEHKKNILVEGNGAEFIFHGKMITFAFDSCENITLQHVSVDFERPTMSEMTFVSTNDTAIVADIHPDSKFDIINGRLVFYGEGWTMQQYHAILVNPVQGTLYYSQWQPFLESTAKIIAPNRVLFKGNFAKNNFHKGWVLTVRDPIRDHVGAFINRSKNVTLKNITMHYMHGLGIVSQFSQNLYYDSVFIQPSRGRQIAAFADGMHFSGCSGNIVLQNCHYAGLHDDPVNIHGTHLQIVKAVSPTVLHVRFVHDQTYGFNTFAAGDSISFVHSASLETYAYGRIKKASLISEREIAIELDSAVPAGMLNGDCVDNITCMPDVTIRNCVFERTVTRGLLITTRGKVLIEHNTFNRTGMYAILIADDATSWFESGPVKDVIIRKNVFRECGYNNLPGAYTINIAPENHEPIKDYYVHHNIHIYNNTFKTLAAPVLQAKSVDELYFTGNSIIKTRPSFAGVSTPMPVFNITACRNVVVKEKKVNP